MFRLSKADGLGPIQGLHTLCLVKFFEGCNHPWGWLQIGGLDVNFNRPWQ